MAEDLVERAGYVREHHLLRSCCSVMFAPVGDGQRRRRGSDAVRLAAAVVALGCCLLLIRYDVRMDRAITEVIHPPPESIEWLVRVVYEGGSFGVVLVLVALAVVARRWEIARDIAVSAAGAAAAGGLLILFLGSRGGRPTGIVIHGYYLSFPILQITVFAAVATAALPYLARGVQRLVEIFIAAFGDHLWLPVLIVIITLAGIIGGVSPSPGGMGAVKPGLILGLTAAGVSEADATAAVFIQRLFTSYLPPIWGWAALVWMRKKEYL